MSKLTSITISIVDSRWLVNGKRLKDCSELEKKFLNDFIAEKRQYDQDLETYNVITLGQPK